jgi:hypothetical protein
MHSPTPAAYDAAILKPEQLQPPERSTVRILTVSKMYREWGSNGSRRKITCFPMLRLQGKWLGGLGLDPGQKAKLIITDSFILITKI